MENIEITAEFSRFALKTRKKDPPKTPRIEPLKDFPNSLRIKELPFCLPADWVKINACFMVGVYKILGATEADSSGCKVLSLLEVSVSDRAVGFNPFPTFFEET